VAPAHPDGYALAEHTEKRDRQLQSVICLQLSSVLWTGRSHLTAMLQHVLILKGKLCTTQGEASWQML